MKTKSKESFWHRRIRLAKKRGRFTRSDLVMARSWVTCACGEQDRRLPRNIFGCPLDLDLAFNGGEFLVAVGANEFGRAHLLLDQIEVRSAQILSKLPRTKK